MDSYSVERGYGLLSDGVSRIPFRAEDFIMSQKGDPPPIVGEEVEVGLVRNGKAEQIKRVSPPIIKRGVVESYDSRKRWGFVREFGSNGRRLFLHGSEITEGWVPIKGTVVEFYEGRRLGKPRACQVSNSRKTG